MIAFPHSKINIGLNVIGKRADGYHNIESCFYPVGWKDALEILSSKELKFNSSGLKIPGDPSSNLCLKAYHLLQKEFGLSSVQIHLHKVIPMGAGLGGGSSDAAFTLKILNEIFKLHLDQNSLLAYAAELGSDCAFFIQEKPVLAKERGNVFEPIQLSLKGYFLVTVNPGLHVDTAQTYSTLTPKKPETSLTELLEKPVIDWKNSVKNDFEEPVFKTFPEVEALKKKMYDLGADYASMTGSGSSVYGLFNKKPSLAGIFPAHYHVWEQLLEE